MNVRESRYLGAFNVETGQLTVSDPGRDEAEHVVSAASGSWYVYTRMVEDPVTGIMRVARLQVLASRHRNGRRKYENGAKVFVTGGRVSIGEARHFKKVNGLFDEEVRRVLRGRHRAGVVGNAAAVARVPSKTAYDCYKELDKNGKVTAIEVVFVYPIVQCLQCGNYIREDLLIGGFCEGCCEDE